MIEHKGYAVKVEFDDEADIFHGEVINVRDIITFEGESVADTITALSISSMFHRYSENINAGIF